MANALYKIRVPGLTHFEAGPSCTDFAAWMGADVIKIEQSGFYDSVIRSRSTLPDAECLYTILLNANSRSVSLDWLKQETVV